MQRRAGGSAVHRAARGSFPRLRAQRPFRLPRAGSRVRAGGGFDPGRAAGDEFVCTHDHHAMGDESLSFALAPGLVESLGAAEVWGVGALPPLPELMVLGELAQAAAEGASDVGIDEVGLLLAERLTETVSGGERKRAGASARDRRRAVEAALWVDANAHDAIDLESAATEAGLSPFHFLRLFRDVLGVTRTNILCAAGCAAPPACWQMMRAPSPISRSTSASRTSPTSCVRFIAQPACRRAALGKAARGNRKILQDRLGALAIG